ncbi:hypothetical protein [Mesorhizobium sp. L-8-3]|uniref:hypothetical protein n=1 Tax=Mesorhizobium sp. L-8-3 TaxID=2744522 RepID=UPI0019286670|nr:hypothetical protein [Mesorhizobium sp. L-8-3]BCH25988.1 hypothetical protein MesoLjLb_57730 [Mesorhizobium sp. L-8-3]
MVKDIAMQRDRTYRTRATDFLSAFFLCVAALLAGAHTPLTDEVRAAASTQASGARGADSTDPQSSPTTARRPFITAEWRVTEASLPQVEGDTKTALPPAVALLPDVDPDVTREAFVLRAPNSSSFHNYGARAPPTSHDQA